MIVGCSGNYITRYSGFLARRNPATITRHQENRGYPSTVAARRNPVLRILARHPSSIRLVITDSAGVARTRSHARYVCTRTRRSTRGNVRYAGSYIVHGPSRLPKCRGYSCRRRILRQRRTNIDPESSIMAHSIKPAYPIFPLTPFSQSLCSSYSAPSQATLLARLIPAPLERRLTPPGQPLPHAPPDPLFPTIATRHRCFSDHRNRRRF